MRVEERFVDRLFEISNNNKDTEVALRVLGSCAMTSSENSFVTNKFRASLGSQSIHCLKMDG